MSDEKILKLSFLMNLFYLFFVPFRMQTSPSSMLDLTGSNQSLDSLADSSNRKKGKGKRRGKHPGDIYIFNAEEIPNFTDMSRGLLSFLVLPKYSMILNKQSFVSTQYNLYYPVSNKPISHG